MWSWNDMTVEEYIEFKRNRVTDTEIAKIKFVSYQTIARWKRQHSITARKSKYGVDDYIKLKEHDKLSDGDVAKLWKMSEQGLNNWKQANNLTNIYPKIFKRVKSEKKDYMLEYARSLIGCD
jgi:hypothetical protein